MHVIFEELSEPQRAGGIEAATLGLVESLARVGVEVTRSSMATGEAPCLTPDCVHLHGIWSPALVRRFRHWRQKGIPCVVTVHGMLEPWALAHKRLKKQVAWWLYQKRLLNQASALHATSPREAENLRRLGLKPRIEIISWGVEMPGGEELSVVRCQLSVEENIAATLIHNPQSTIHNPKRTALFVGRIYPVKGLPLLVEAWAKVRPRGWKMRIVGPDEAGHRAEVEELVGSAGLTNEFEFAGGLSGEALHQAYADAELLILPSHTENFGMVVAEALAHGRPVIATQGSPWSGLVDHECGWWPEISSAGIADALQAATSLDSATLRLMGARGRDWMVKDFSWPQTARRMADLYRDLIESR